MKRLLTIAAALGLLASGCETTPKLTKEDVCSIATTAYAIYLAVINSDGKPSDDQIAAAQAAAVVLQAQCGWGAPATITTTRATVKSTETKRVDAWGVPVLVPKR